METIRHRVGIAADPNDVFAALIDPERIVGWWAATAARGAASDAPLVLGFPGYRDLVWDIAELADARRVHLKLVSGPDEWAGSALLFELNVADDQVFLTLTHSTSARTPAEAFQFFCTKWPLFLVSLKEYLESGRGRPYPNDVKIQH